MIQRHALAFAKLHQITQLQNFDTHHILEMNYPCAGCCGNVRTEIQDFAITIIMAIKIAMYGLQLRLVPEKLLGINMLTC